MSHFKVTMLKVCNLDQSVEMSTLKKGLKGGPFYFSLSKRFSYNLTEMLARTNKYINIEEGMVEKQKEKGKQKKA